jgi:hypothetical protein
MTWQPPIDFVRRRRGRRTEGSAPPSTLLGVAFLGYTNQLVEIEAVSLAPPPSEPAPSP